MSKVFSSDTIDISSYTQFIQGTKTWIYEVCSDTVSDAYSALITFYLLLTKWLRSELNQRPQAYESRALTN